jgi:hypothetical protein
MIQELRAGAAEAVITPPLGVDIYGAYHREQAEQILSDLYARTLVLDDGDTSVAIITLDLCVVPPEVADTVCRRVEDRTGVPSAQVMLTCTHTHTGPAVAATPWYGPDEAYVDVLIRRIADVVVTARRRLEPARLLAGKEHEASVSFHRRFWMADGTLRTNPDYQDPNIVRAAGPIDPDVLVLRVENPAGKPMAILVNFAMHPAIVGGLDFVDGPSISADFPGAMAEVLKNTFGRDVAVLFANGACGNINHRDRSKPGPQAGQKVADAIGTILAGDVIKAHAHLQPIDDASPLAFRSRDVDLPLRLPSPDELAWAQDFTRAEMYVMDVAGMEVVRAHRILGLWKQEGTHASVSVQALTAGSFACVTLPGEPFAELGMAIKQGSPFPHTFVGELNGTTRVGYIPIESEYGRGGYEDESSNVVPGSGERLVATALDLLGASVRQKNLQSATGEL